MTSSPVFIDRKLQLPSW